MADLGRAFHLKMTTGKLKKAFKFLLECVCVHVCVCVCVVLETITKLKATKFNCCRQQHFHKGTQCLVSEDINPSVPMALPE